MLRFLGMYNNSVNQTLPRSHVVLNVFISLCGEKKFLSLKLDAISLIERVFKFYFGRESKPYTYIKDELLIYS